MADIVRKAIAAHTAPLLARIAALEGRPVAAITEGDFDMRIARLAESLARCEAKVKALEKSNGR